MFNMQNISSVGPMIPNLTVSPTWQTPIAPLPAQEAAFIHFYFGVRHPLTVHYRHFQSRTPHGLFQAWLVFEHVFFPRRMVVRQRQRARPKRAPSTSGGTGRAVIFLQAAPRCMDDPEWERAACRGNGRAAHLPMPHTLKTKLFMPAVAPPQERYPGLKKQCV